MNLNQAEGIIFGLAIGDAIGAPVEFIGLDEIQQRYGSEGITKPPVPALYTDDTQMTIAITEALIRQGECDVETIMEAVREEFVDWRHSPDNNRAPGNACLIGVSQMERGIHWSESGIPDSKGCGSAMRVATIGYLYQDNPSKLKEVAAITSMSTHGHPTATASAVGAAYLVKLALENHAPENIIPSLLSFTQGISTEFDQHISRIESCLSWQDEEEALEYLGRGWIGEEAVALALYCFLRYPDDYRSAVIRAANTNGDSDSIACIAGSISGAYLGAERIPPEWKSRIEKADYLKDLALRLFQKKGNSIEKYKR
ncbi:MAG: ADP-ribosylglycohydrolase family protein [Thermodesulfobacteriota bacterium]